MMDDTINRQSTIDTIHKTICGFFDVAEDDSEEPISEKDKFLLEVNKAICNGIKELPSSQPQDIARDIATIIENEQDMRVVLKNAEHTETHEWIPCSERMPEEHEWMGTKRFGTTISDEVYVTFENPKGERFCKHLSFQNGKLSGFDQSTIDAFYKGSKPIAWMPLPKPYAERKEDASSR